MSSKLGYFNDWQLLFCFRNLMKLDSSNRSSKNFLVLQLTRILNNIKNSIVQYTVAVEMSTLALRCSSPTSH
jgi:hypothetical protein